MVAEKPAPAWFSPDYWRERHALTGSATGRGEAYFIARHDGARWVLRHYRRGGILGHVNPDFYLYVGAARSRPMRELRILAELSALDLPVPTPVAAMAIRHGLSYRADLITREIPRSRTLADRLETSAMDIQQWTELGRLIARFHRAGLWHADLNARNVLLDNDARFHLIDLDRARWRRDGAWRQANVARLRRSLDKFARRVPGFAFFEADWEAFLGGYASGGK